MRKQNKVSANRKRRKTDFLNKVRHSKEKVTKFPQNFIWGVATSATQTEGAVCEDGKGLNIWDAFSSVRGNIGDGTTTSDACGSYYRYGEDIELLKELGVNGYRFSVSWSRVLPEGKGKINQKGLDYYKRLTDELVRAGIQPNITLYHWDLPYELHRLGGWLNRDCADWFAEYASIVYKALADRVPLFATVNEPIATYIGYARKAFAPGFGVESYGRQACHHLLLAHGKAAAAMRAADVAKHAQIGVAVDIWNRVPLNEHSEQDIAKAEYENENAHRAFLYPLLTGKYTDFLPEQMAREGTTPAMQEGDMRLIHTPLDFFGLNVFGRFTVSADENADIETEVKKKGGQYTSSGEYYPAAAYEAAQELRRTYGLRAPIYITENGLGYYGEETLSDGYRTDYIKGFLGEIARANADGCDIRGYYHWSLSDNWEWCAGLKQRFGLTTRNRKRKQSFTAYAKIIANNGF